MNSKDFVYWINVIRLSTSSCNVRICSEKNLPDELNGLYICNIDDKHWIVLMQCKNTPLQYFDPLGYRKTRLLIKYSRHGSLISMVKLQDSSSNDCGYFCLMYTILRLKFNRTMFASLYQLLVHKENMCQFNILKSCILKKSNNFLQ